MRGGGSEDGRFAQFGLGDGDVGLVAVEYGSHEGGEPVGGGGGDVDAFDEVFEVDWGGGAEVVVERGVSIGGGAPDDGAEFAFEFKALAFVDEGEEDVAAPGDGFVIEVDVLDDADVDGFVAAVERGCESLVGGLDGDAFVALEVEGPHGGGFVFVDVPAGDADLPQDALAHGAESGECVGIGWGVSWGVRCDAGAGEGAFKGVEELVGAGEEEGAGVEQGDEFGEVEIAPDLDGLVGGGIRIRRGAHTWAVRFWPVCVGARGGERCV